MKVLISAYACDPGVGSERGAGWAWALAAARDHEVWLLTRCKNRSKLEEALRIDPSLRLHPVYLDLPRWAAWWKGGSGGVFPYYVLWQVLAGFHGRRLHRTVSFDVAHHLTFALDWLPAGVCFIPGLPAVWGPVGGATMPPRALWPWLGPAGAPWEVLRAIVTGLGRRTFGRVTARRSAMVVAQNHDVAAFFRGHPDVIVEQHIALPPAVGSLPRRPGCDGERRAVFVARLLRWKGIRLAVAALAEPDARGWRLEVFGEGPERRSAEQLAERFGVADRVHFHGLVARSQVLEGLQHADALLFPSLHDAAGWAVAEALREGCPVVALDIGGPGSMVPEGGGLKVRPSRSVVRDVARSLAAIRGPLPPIDRWNEDRVPALLEEWYSRATASSGRRRVRSSPS